MIVLLRRFRLVRVSGSLKLSEAGRSHRDRDIGGVGPAPLDIMIGDGPARAVAARKYLKPARGSLAEPRTHALTRQSAGRLRV